MKYKVGRTNKVSPEWPFGVPCILVDDASVFAEFSTIPTGGDDAEKVCKMLNGLELLKSAFVE